MQPEQPTWQGFMEGHRVWDTTRSTVVPDLRHPTGTVHRILAKGAMVVFWDSGRTEKIEHASRARQIAPVPDGKDILA